ncbi:MAG: hypothetical protein V3T86_05935 [Planctomycetota bacterium]
MEWTHPVHLCMSTWYLSRNGPDEGVKAMRETILRFNAHNGIEMTPERGYHETLTVAWLRIVAWELARCPADLSLPERAGHVIEHCRDMRRLRDHYTRETMMSWKARTEWVEPDLVPLPKLER